METARELANITISQFEEHGDLSYAQSFYDAMPKNYVRRAAFIKWMADHSPIVVSNDLFSKDKSDEAVGFRVDLAHKTSFWEYAPDPEQVHFGSNDVVVALKRTIAKFGKERYTAASDKAAIAVNHAKVMIETLEDELAGKIADQDNDEDEDDDDVVVPEASTLTLSDDVPVQAQA